MSVLDLPRIHFRGVARMRVPTGNRNHHGAIDLSTNDVYQDGEKVDLTQPPSAYHRYLLEVGPRYNARGEWDPEGAFSMASGWDLSANNHFAWNAQVVSTQRRYGEIDRSDSVIGTQVELWGHHNEYLGTTFNRARMVDCDPTSNWTTQVIAGHFTFGRRGASHKVPNLFSAPVDCTQHARWQHFDHIRGLTPNCNNFEFGRAALYQFTIPKDGESVHWSPGARHSDIVTHLQGMMDEDGVSGIVVQYALFNMSAPMVPNAPVFMELVGTIGVWRSDEMRTYPAGRLLVPPDAPSADACRTVRINNAAIQVGAHHVSLNMAISVPRVGRESVAGLDRIHHLGPMLDLGGLELRTCESNRLIARIPRAAYQADAYQKTSGILDMPLEDDGEDLHETIHQEALRITESSRQESSSVLLCERELNVQVEDGNIYLEYPNRRKNEDHARSLEVRSFLRGRPASIEAIYVRQYYNPKAFPQLRYTFEHDPTQSDRQFSFPGNDQLYLVQLKPGTPDHHGAYAGRCALATDAAGRGWLSLRGHRAGTARVLMSEDPERVPCPGVEEDEALRNYDNEDRLHFWSGMGGFTVRVLPDDWALEEVDDDQVDFDFLYRHVLAYYELIYSFMAEEVFSLADQCKAETYARLMWQMSDPRNKHKTYYMPPTRELSYPKAMLFLKYLRRVQKTGYVPSINILPKAPQRRISTREALVRGLRDAVELELAVMVQYTYAAFSIPNYTTGMEYVRRGLWTEEHLHLLCGDGAETRDYGCRGVLLEVAHEEMIHFLLANNLLMAVGEPFHAAASPVARMNRLFPVDVEFTLEPFSPSAVQRFVRLEWPDYFEREVAGDFVPSPDENPEGAPQYGSINELYRQIRQAFEDMPELIVVEKGHVGGEHHLFLREHLNKNHPDYQLQIDDLESALFAIDFISEQSEGISPDSAQFPQSHFQRFRTMAQRLAQIQTTSFQGDGSRQPWVIAYPALRNPTLRRVDGYSNLVTATEARQVMSLFDGCYFLMMQLMVQHFGQSPTGTLRRSKLMNASIDVMTGMLRPLGELLMALPSGKRGRTAGPSFELHETPVYNPMARAAYRTMARRFEGLRDKAHSCAVINHAIYELLSFYVEFFDEMADNEPPPPGAQLL